ncbi:hypothetical protein A2U01_0077851, partial [Trifolium medium]|nr:hypothetical protein [Trifolium medium]
MKRGTKKSYVSKDTKKASDAFSSKQHKDQIKLKIKQEVIVISSESDVTQNGNA